MFLSIYKRTSSIIYYARYADKLEEKIAWISH
jgi:hypothetical protein